jgi:hypothetical protein
MKDDPHKWPPTSKPPFTHIECLECGVVKHLYREIGDDGMIRVTILDPQPPPTCP